MEKTSLKQNKGMTMTDVIAAIIILCLFTGIIGNLYYQIVFNSNMIKLNSTAVYYVVKISEEIDKISYEEVTSELANTLKEKYSIPDSYVITINVENYNKDDASKEDIIKIVTIKAEYECFKEKRQYEIKKLKIKEI